MTEMASGFTTRMADLARDLRSHGSSVLTLQHIVRATSELVQNCDDVAVTVARSDGSVETLASLGAGLAERCDQLQQVHRQGPCVDSAWDTPLQRLDHVGADAEWPAWSAAVADEVGVRSLMCVQLFTHEHHDLGALQLFSTRPAAFDRDAADEVLGIAAHAAVALGTVASLEAMQFGLVRRTMIGQATGMLMERYGLGPHQAFEVLRRTSQETGVKVYALAIDMVNGKEGPRP